MSVWITQGLLALVNGLIVFLLTLIPVVAWQYRRYGVPSLARLVGAVTLALYVTALLTYTWLPLPQRDTLDCAKAPQGQFLPGGFIGDIAAAAERFGFPHVLWSFQVLQVVFNVLLFVPWGVIVRQFLHRSIVVTTASGLAASLLIEGAQLTGLFGIYPCAYRVFDVDDLLLNTLGSLIGALIAPILLWWMPRARDVSERRLAARPVTMWRRWAGQAIDAFAFVILSSVMSVVLLVGALALGIPTPQGVGSLGVIGTVVGIVLPWIVCFVVPPWGGWAASGGQYAVWLTPMWRDASGALGHATRLRRLARANVVAGPLLLTSLIIDLVGPLPVMRLLWFAPAVLSVVLVPFTLTHRSLSGIMTRCEFVDIRDHDDVDEPADGTGQAGFG